jgi:hypothetical protein
MEIGLDSPVDQTHSLVLTRGNKMIATKLWKW